MLKVQTSKIHFLAVPFFLLMELLCLFIFVAGIIEFNPLAILGALFGMIIFLIPMAILFYLHFKTVKYLTNEGLVRNDGQKFAWKDLSRVVQRNRAFRMRFQKGKIERLEIHFNNSSTAYIIPDKVNNFAEVHNFVRSLPCEHLEK